MKAISLWQPWASLWLSGRKVHETRSWPTSHRGPLYVHAAQKFVRDCEQGSALREILEDEFGGHWGMDLPTGAVIGIVDLVDCVSVDSLGLGHQGSDDFFCGDFSAGRFAWRCSNPRLFSRPLPNRGRQRIFNIPDDLLPEARS